MISFIRKNFKYFIYVLTILSVVIIPLFIHIRNIFFVQEAYMDFMICMTAGQRILNHELIYNAEEITNNMAYLYAPYFAYLVGLFREVVGHERITLFIWFLANYLFLWIILKIIRKLLIDDNLPPPMVF